MNFVSNLTVHSLVLRTLAPLLTDIFTTPIQLKSSRTMLHRLFSPFLYVMLPAMGLYLSSCQNDAAQASRLQEGPWHFELALNDTAHLPFQASLERAEGQWKWRFFNASETIELTMEEGAGDSIRLPMPVFDTEFVGVIADPQTLSGAWYDYTRGDEYAIPFEAKAGETPRFQQEGAAVSALAPLWKTTFSPHSEYASEAIGEFHQAGKTVIGTFRTPTGDYRYLDGVLVDSQLHLSTFDGSHVFLFTADLQPDGSLQGDFLSGKHYHTDWVAQPDSTASLPNPDSLTFLKPEAGPLTFAFPDGNGDTLTYPNEALNNKVVIVQLMGSWCPNCMDESRLYAQWYKRYHEQGLEIIGLAFERSKTFELASKRVDRMKANIGIEYPVLIAALTTSKATAAEKLPMLNHVLSYPTSIFIDRSGQVRRIHTGFNGPGTGIHYTEYVADYERLIESMLAGGEL